MTRRPSRILSISALTAAFVLTGCSTGDTPGSGPASTSAPVAAATIPAAAGATASEATTATSMTSMTSTSAGDTSLPGGQASGRGNTYTVTAPVGWGAATDMAGTSVAGLDLVLLSSKKVSKFSNNLVVTVSSGGAGVVEEQLETGRTTMADAGREVVDADDVQIAGVTAKGFTTRFEQQGVRITARSYGMERNGKVYLLTLSSSQDDAANALQEFTQILDSWKWQ